MRGLLTHRHHWFVLAERGAVRAFLMLIGLVLMVLGLALGISIVMLPVGVAVGLAGVGLFVWGTVGEMPLEE